MRKSKKKGIFCFVLLIASFLIIGNEVVIAQDVEVIETEFKMEETRTPKDATDMELTQVELKEKEIVQINRSFKKVIEGNMELREKNKELDRRFRNMLGQRNIDVNRMNTVTAERDAYKQQNEQIFGLNKKFAKDIDALKSQLASREKELNEKIKNMEVQLAQKRQEEEMLQEDSPLAQLLESVVADQKKSLDVLKMVDELNHENEKIISGKAKIHYNMGNIFFNQGNYKEAIKEYKTAVRLAPQDPDIHFNLAFVSGEYLKDHKIARKHYRKYLYLKPDAEDTVLVQEKILEAELHLKVEIPESSLERNPKFRNRLIE